MAQDTIEHFGVLGMHWGQHKLAEKARSTARRAEKARFQSDLKRVGKNASVTEVVGVSKTHDKNMAKIDAEFEKATGKKLPKGPVGDRIAAGLGMKKDSKGVWQATPEAYAKATTIGIGLGFASFFAEMGIRHLVSKAGVESVTSTAAYKEWLKHG